MTINFDAIVSILEKGGLLAVALGLIYLVFLLIEGKLIGRKVHDEVVKNYQKQLEDKTKDCEFFRHIAFRNIELAERIEARVITAPVTSPKS